MPVRLVIGDEPSILRALRRGRRNVVVLDVGELQSLLEQAAHQLRDQPGPAPLAQPASSSFDWDRYVAERLAAGSENLYAETVERAERELLLRVLRHTRGNQVQAARILGITRGSVRTKIRTLGISIACSVCAQDEQGG
jgi:two-component system nitrogen regulation response regulator GlnG